ncbi:MAG TPA: PIG-L family deacetylase [Terriglobales bacterium]|nr:PIG-L family deacetylase [Terriglobales bacterium]
MRNLEPLDILAIAAHRDDVEQTCGGTLLKMAERGRRTGILDLTRGEMGTRGSAEDREREAAEAAKILRVSWREALDIPDGRVENTWENRLNVARVIRETRPRVVILPYWKGRHPDHYTASKLGYEACFLAGLAKLDIDRGPSNRQSAFSQVASAVASVVAGEKQTRPSAAKADHAAPSGGTTASRALAPHRPYKIIYATLYYDIRPTFVVDITQQFEARFESLMAYKTQFSDQEAGKDIFPARDEIRARIESMARFYGMLAGVTYAEPFLQKEVGLVDDVMAIPVKSI